MSTGYGTVYIAGAMHHPGTNVPTNITGECPHRHRSIEAARRCIDDMDRAIKKGHGPHAYCDRVVIALHHSTRGPWQRHPLGAACPICPEES